VLSNLESLGFIYRETNSSDKRSVKVYLTELGKEKRKVAKDVVREFNEYMEAQLTEKEKEQLIKSLQKINELAQAYAPNNEAVAV